MDDAQKDNKISEHLFHNHIYTLIYDLYNYGTIVHNANLKNVFVWMLKNLDNKNSNLLIDYIYGVRYANINCKKNFDEAFDYVFDIRKALPMYEERNNCFFSGYGLEERVYSKYTNKLMIIPLKYLKLSNGLCLYESELCDLSMKLGVSEGVRLAFAELIKKYKELECKSVFDKKYLYNHNGHFENSTLDVDNYTILYRIVKFWDAYGRITNTVTDLNHIRILKGDNMRSLEGMFSSTVHFLNTDNVKNKTPIFNFLKKTKWVYNIDSWDVSDIINMRNIFRYAKYIPECIAEWDVRKVGNFSGAFKSTEYIPDISGWQTESVNIMCEMFSEANYVPDISNWKVGTASDISYIFHSAGNVPDVSMWDVGGVFSMSYAFAKTRITTDLSRWNTENVMNFEGMFEGSYFAIDTDFSQWNVSRCSNFSRMFKQSSGHLWVDTKPRRTSGLSAMMRNCVPISIDIAAWDVGRAIIMNDMFCGSDFATDLSEWNVENVAEALGFDRYCEFPHKNPDFKYHI